MKKLVSVFLIATMLMSVFALAPLAETDYSGYEEIATEADLLDFIETAADDGCMDMAYVLTADITMTQAWTNIDWFAGTLDGNGHTITLTQPMEDSMFNDLDMSSIIKNLTVTGINVSGDTHVFGLAKSANGNIWDCNFVDAKMTATGEEVGLIGVNQGMVSRVNVINVEIVGAGNIAGGIANRAKAGSVIRYCTVSGSITSNYHVGGIVGDANGGGEPVLIESCLNFATVTARESRAGGISATNQADVTVRNCGNYGTIIAYRGDAVMTRDDTKVSGMGCWEVGSKPYVVENCFNAGMLIGGYVNPYIGGITGRSDYCNNNVKNCYSLENMLYRYADVNRQTTEPIADSWISGVDGSGAQLDGNERNTNGTVVTADVFKSAEMITKLGAAFQLNIGDDKDEYPIILAVDTTEAPSPEIESGDTTTPGGDTTIGGDSTTGGDTTTTTAPADNNETDAPATTTAAPAPAEEEGCASVIGGATVALLAIAGVAPMVIRKKKED